MNSGWMIGQSILNGLTMGGIYALVSVGLTIIFGVMKVVNFSQGECLMVGMYMTYWMQKLTHLDPYFLFLPVAAIMFCIGLLIFRAVIQHMLEREKTSIMVVTMGLAFVLVTVMQLIFTPNSQSVLTNIKQQTISIGVFSVGTTRLIACGVMAFLVLGVYLFLKFTDAGRAMRATSENTQVAQMLGINTKRTYMYSFAIGIMMAGVTGLLLSPTYFVNPSVGAPFKTIAMVCVVIGGLGNIGGAVLGGMMAGLVEAFLGSYVSFDLAPGGTYFILILILALRPQGLFGKGARLA